MLYSRFIILPSKITGLTGIFSMDSLSPQSNSRPRTNWLKVIYYLLGLLAVAVCIDLYGLYRVQAFSHETHNIERASGTLWITVPRKHGEVLSLITSDKSYAYSCDFPGLGGSNTCEHKHELRSGAYSEVDWVSAPHGLLSGTIMFPVAIRQAGQAVLQVGPDQIAGIQSRKIESDLEFLGIFSSLLVLIAFFIILNRKSNG